MLLASLPHRSSIASLAALAAIARRLQVQRVWLSRFSSAQREAALTGACIAAAFLAILHYDLGGLIFAAVEHRPDYKRDTLILAGLTMSLGFAVFALRRWFELGCEIKVRIAAEARANTLAREDALTGLPNRRALSAELALAVARAGRCGEPVSLLLMDLDRFKPVNDVYGHMVGDMLLQEITRRLRATVRSGEFVARLGGDEFAVIVCHHPENRGAPVAAAKRISEALCAAFTLGSTDVHVGVSTGIATFPFDAEDVEALMRRADVALYRAKERGRGRCELFDATMDTEIRERAAIENDLRQAILAGDVVPYFQPLIELRGGRIVGFEALARWRHARHGFIPPSSFIPIAEESGLIGDLGLAMLRQGCRQARQWGGDVLLSVNISPIQLADRRLAEKILSVLTEEGLPPRRLEVEITENTLVSDVEGARVILNQLKREGVSICLDDFGAGYSSLTYLKRYPIDKLKIDRSFIHDIPGDAEDVAITSAMISLAKSLGMRVLAEGVENAAQFDFLRAQKCDEIQGYYVSRPLPPDEFLNWMTAKCAARKP